MRVRRIPFVIGTLALTALAGAVRSEAPTADPPQVAARQVAEPATSGAPSRAPQSGGKRTDGAAIANPNIDMPGFLKSAQEAALHRESRRLAEADFLKMSREPGVIVLDARSKEKFDLLHIRGAINLSFPDIDIASLKKALPDLDARILIYCNNNFKNADRPFPPKQVVSSLNLSTYITLYQHGYRNVYELGPQLDPKDSILPFESSPQSTTK